MADEVEKKPYSVKTLMEYFGRRPGENIKAFAEELKGLSDEEKIQLTQGIENGTLTY